jgi:hypothetical protein
VAHLAGHVCVEPHAYRGTNGDMFEEWGFAASTSDAPTVSVCTLSDYFFGQSQYPLAAGIGLKPPTRNITQTDWDI